jgi:preprotein translocase subunit SecY
MKAEELLLRIAFTLGALILYRIGTYIPLPGIDPFIWDQFFRSQQGGTLAAVDVLSGGAVHRLSIFALGINPFISAAILIQVTSMGVSTLARLRTEGERGRRLIHWYTLCLTLVLVIFQSYGVSVGMEGMSGLVAEPGLGFRVSTVAMLTGGTLFVIWLSEQITLRGIGNGLALILCTAVVTQVPSGIASMIELSRQAVLSTGFVLFMLAMAVAVISFIVFVERVRVSIPLEFPGRQVGAARRMSDLSLKINSAGVIPFVASSWLLLVPLTFVGLLGGPGWLSTAVEQLLGPGRGWHMIYSFAAIIFLALVYTAFLLSPTDVAEKLKQYGGNIPGIEPGEPTAKLVDNVLSRTALLGAVYLAFICLIPEMLTAYAQVPIYLGGVPALIVVATVLDIGQQIRVEALA